MQYRELLHEWAWYFHEPNASENAAHECNNHDMHANECNKMFSIHYHNSVVSLLTKYRVTRRSNAQLLILKHIMVARIPRFHRARAVTPVQYRVILHGTGIGKYCCRNINWIIN